MSQAYWRHSGRRASAQQGPPGPGHPEQRLATAIWTPASARSASSPSRVRAATSPTGCFEHRKRAETALITVVADCRPAGVSRRRMAPRTHTARTSRPGPGSSRPRASASRPSPGSSRTATRLDEHVRPAPPPPPGQGQAGARGTWSQSNHIRRGPNRTRPAGSRGSNEEWPPSVTAATE